ncbi:hypothetical protein [Mycobacterium sp. IDR2000157661]|uniref:hypothetical protein n=1 Tax=Mycobacterium sp. IDR2000157661 TaxID=2867005 RepID=UPI001EECC702|nr:hypothetical protein [Mycobacterium sp. IDR2000157661]ULE32056.1 hypothetical protein K3G64_18090 [Mycobacterium sp. IDR2000157661]
MNLKKAAVAAGVAGALSGATALGLGAGAVQADPKFPTPPVPPVPGPPGPNAEAPKVDVPRGPDLKLPPGQVPPGPPANVPPGPPANVPPGPPANVPPGPPANVPPGPPANVPPGPLGNVPPGQVPPPLEIDLPDLLPDVPEVDDYFKLGGAKIPPGQLKNAAFINGIPNPFYGIPPGQLMKMRTVQGFENPFFDEAPGHWEIPEWGVPDAWPGLPEVDDFFGLPSEQLRPEQLTTEEVINGVPNPFFGIAPDELRKLPTVQGFENPFFEGTAGHWDIP